MTRALSQDLRTRLLAVVDEGLSRNAAAERFGVAVSTAVRWVRAWRAEGREAALPQGGDLRSQRIEACGDVILAAVDAEVGHHAGRVGRAAPQPAWCLVRPEHRVALPRSPRSHLQKTAHASEQERPDVAARRQAWFDAQPDLDPKDLVFIDETGA